MAIDTLAKRAAALTFGRVGFLQPPPSGTTSLLTRATLVGCYGYGGAPAVLTYPVIFLTGNIQRNTAGTGGIQRNVPVTNSIQRNVALTADARSNS